MKESEALWRVIELRERHEKMDYGKMFAFAQKYVGKTTYECIEAYAEKNKIVFREAGRVFWGAVDEGKVNVHKKNGLLHIL